jgi:hypothetical protein
MPTFEIQHPRYTLREKNDVIGADASCNAISPASVQGMWLHLQL